MVPLSILDLVRIRPDSGVRGALDSARDLAAHAEQWGYQRYWVAEHHNNVSIASSATSLVISHIAAGTSHIRVGSGGIMLPNHSPLIIAEQFGTLAHLYPNRIDLGLGRAPGTDQQTWRAMRRSPNSPDRFPEDVAELQFLLDKSHPGQAVFAIPGVGSQVPLWILGSSLFGAQLAAEMGLPYAFASHFAPQELLPALSVYRRNFKPSKQCSTPFAMMGVNVIVAETDAEANFLATTKLQAFTNLLRGQLGLLQQPPVDNIDDYWTDNEKRQVGAMLKYSVVGSPGTVHAGLERLLTETGVDEFIVVSDIYDHSKRLESYRLLAQSFA